MSSDLSHIFYPSLREKGEIQASLEKKNKKERQGLHIPPTKFVES